MIFFYSNRRIYADSFIQSLKSFLGTDVRLCLFDLVTYPQTPDLVVIDGKGLHPQRLKKIVRLYDICPIVLISSQTSQLSNVAAVVSDEASIRDVADICRLILGKGNSKINLSFNVTEETLLQGLAQGRSNKEMARDYDLALSTVKYHLQNLYQKMGVNNRTQAALKLRETTLL